MVSIFHLAILFLYVFLNAGDSNAETLRVGHGLQYATPSDAALIAQDGDTIEISAGEYRRDVAVWAQDNLTIRGMGTGAQLLADGFAAEDKAIWVIKGNDVLIENVEFSGAKVADQNGAGIRHEGSNLTVRNCRFHENENGILSGKGSGEILIQNSIFFNNGYGDGQSHNIYIGMIDRLTVRGSYFHHANVGHQIKSRARENYIAYNKIMDGYDGNSSYLVDLPNGGHAVLIGNVLQQGPHTENWALIAFGAELKNSKSGELLIVNNTFVNDNDSGLFLSIANPYVRVHIQNNIFLGMGQLSNQEVRNVSNLALQNELIWPFNDKIFVDRESLDYHLAEGSKAIDAASSSGLAGDDNLWPQFEYDDIAALRPRTKNGKLDLGAYEYSGR